MLNLAEYRKKNAQLADFLPWAALVAPGVVLNKDGSFQRTARIAAHVVGGEEVSDERRLAVARGHVDENARDRAVSITKGALFEFVERVDDFEMEVGQLEVWLHEADVAKERVGGFFEREEALRSGFDVDVSHWTRAL